MKSGACTVALAWFVCLAPCSAEAVAPAVAPTAAEFFQSPWVSPRPAALAGNVYLDGRAFADDNGAQGGAWGVTMFWALWAEHEDRQKLLDELDWLAGWSSVDYVRVLAMVGSQPYWQGRVIDPEWADYDATLNRLLDDCAARGLRAEVVLFADAQVMMPDHDDRIAWVHRMAGLLEGRRSAVQFVEIANESNLNGVEDWELAELTTLWDQISDIPVAPSSPDGGNAEEGINRLFGEHDVSADLLTPHFDRDQREEGYRPHRQPWEAQFYATPTTVFTSNEPIGPGSSGNSDRDPARLAIGMANTFIAGGAGYVLHSHAGVRGDDPLGNDLTNAIMRSHRFVSEFMPAQIANGSTCNHHWECHPYEDHDQIWPDHDGTGVVRAFGSEVDGVFYVAVMGMRDHYFVTAKWPMTVEVFDVRNGDRLEVVELDGGEPWTFYQHGELRDYLHRIHRGFDICDLEVALSDYPSAVDPGSTVEFTATATNSCGDPLTFDRAVMNISGPVSLEKTLYDGRALRVDESIGANVRLPVPEGAPVGRYTVTVTIYRDGSAIHSDAFAVDVNGGVGLQFRSGFEPGHPMPHVDRIELIANVEGYFPEVGPECGPVPEEPGAPVIFGSGYLRAAGSDVSDSENSYCYFHLFDTDLAVSSGSVISYWAYRSVNQHTAIDLVFDDGSNLRDSGLRDQNNNPVHPADIDDPIQEWLYYEIDLSPLSGRSIEKILFGYDDKLDSETGQFRAYVDEIRVLGR